MGVIVAIDGPAGSGKSTIAKRIAQTLGFSYVDTGAIYRSLALYAKEQGIDDQNEEALAELALKLPLQFVSTFGEQQVLLSNKDVSNSIRTAEISQQASIISQKPKVRQNLLELQRRLGREAKNGAVLEGRDIGTVVFPDAEVKFFLEASDLARAERRFLQLKDSDTSLSEVYSALQERDQRDQNRKVAPLVAAPDAVILDSTSMSLEEVTNTLLNHITTKIGQEPL